MQNGNAKEASMATEMEVFLPGDGSNLKDNTTKYKVTVGPMDADPDYLNGGGKDHFDPFKARNVSHPTTDCDTLTHLLKASLGTGILSMPLAFMYTGLTVGIFATILVAVVCTHCSYILVKCAHALYHRTRVSAMSFADVGEVAFANGPQFWRKFSGFARITILFGLFLTYFGTCSVYTVIIAKNFQQVIEYYTNTELDERLMIATLLIPLILLGWVPNLKYLAPVSMIANAFMGIGLAITFYYLVNEIPPISERAHATSVHTLPQFLSIVIFAMEAIGVVMPLENSMKNPTHFVGVTGVLNQGMSGVTLIYIFLGFLGYLKYGDETADSITLNLPNEDILAQTVKILVALAVYCTYGLQFYVCLEIGWNWFKGCFPKHPRIGEYFVRTLLVTASVVLAIAVPTIGPFIGLIGAFCFSILGLIVPALIECITFWDDGGLGKYNWRLWKNIAVGLFGVVALVSGTYTSIVDIIKVYSDAPATFDMGLDNSTLLNATSNFLGMNSTALNNT